MSTRNLLPAPIDAQPVEEFNAAQRIEELEKEVSDLRSEMDRNFRQVSDLFRSAKITFGSSTPAAPSASGPIESDKWERLKAKLGGKMGEIIEALQLNSPSTATQLYNTVGGSYSNIKLMVNKLRDMGLLVKNGDGWSLKP